MKAATMVVAAAIAAAAATPTLAGQATSPVLFDPHLTIGAGATTTTTLGEALARVEDAVVPHRLLTEDGTLRRTTNVTFRLAKFALFDVPQERLLLVMNHEVFGHGARLREAFGGPIAYTIHLPPPYGRGGGSTSFVFDRIATLHERLAVHGAGMEASAVAAGQIAHRAFSERRMRPRDTLRYLTFELDTLSYILSTDEDGEEPGHDVADFLGTYNDLAVAYGTRALTRRALAGKRWPVSRTQCSCSPYMESPDISGAVRVTSAFQRCRSQVCGTCRCFDIGWLPTGRSGR